MLTNKTIKRTKVTKAWQIKKKKATNVKIN